MSDAPAADWPQTVPVLVADDVLVCDERDSEGDRRTLSLWVRLSFAAPDQADRVREVLTQTVASRLGRRKPAGYYELGQPGDGVTPDPRATPEVMAKAWNAAMRELGYDAPDPKPRRKPRRKPQPQPEDDDFLE